jgi:hypothetical protein
MSLQIINIGQSANDKTGDPLRTAFTKVNANFTELYNKSTIPTQSGNAGLYLATDGSNLIWTSVTGVGGASLPLQTGNSGKYLTTNGTNASWIAAVAGAGTLTGTTLASNVVSSSLTSVGSLTSLIVSGTTTLGGNTTINGNLNVNGIITTVNQSNLTVNNSLIYLAQGNAGNSVDIGLVGTVTSNKYVGLVKHAADGLWYLFSNDADSITSTINPVNITKDTLVANLQGNVTGNVTGSAGSVTNGVLTTGTYADPAWITSLSQLKVLPAQSSGLNGYVLTTNGTTASWSAAYSLPTASTTVLGGVKVDGITITITNGVISGSPISIASLSGNNGKYLTTDGTSTSWTASSTILSGVSVASSNGFAGSNSSGALTISTSITGMLKGNGTSISAAVAGTDYQTAQSVTGLVKSSGTTRSAATSGTDYAPGTSALATGIVKSTTTTGALTIAVSGTDYQAPIGTISGIVKGNGANALTAAVAGTDYIAPYTSQTQNYMLASPSGASGIPTFRALVAADIPGTLGSTAHTGSVTLNASANLVFSGSTSGSITFAAGATPATQSYTLPAAYPGTTGYVLSSTTAGVLSWAATVTSVSVTSANGFTGTVATSTSTPAITITTSITGMLKGNGTAISAATAGTDYQAAISATGLLKSSGVSGNVTAATSGTDYAPGTSALTTGIVKSTTTTGALTIAVSGTDYQAPIGTISGLVKGNGANALTAAVAGTDYQSAQSVTGIVKSSGTTRSAATSGTDYAPGTSALTTGIVKSTTTTGALTIAVAGTDYQAPIGTITGLVKGNGANTLAAATSGSDYAPGTSALTTGIVKSTTATGALSIAVAGTDYIAPYTSQTANYILAAPSGSAGTPTFRAMTAADVPGTLGTTTHSGSVTLNGSANLIFTGSTSGTVTFTAGTTPAVQSYTLPTAYPGATGYILSSTTTGALSWINANGTVTSVSVASANGFTGTVATNTTTPAITITTSITGVLKGNGTAISAATSGTDYSPGTSALATGIVKSTTTTGALTIAVVGTDYQAPVSATGILKSSGVSGNVSAATAGTDYQAPVSATGILKSSGVSGNVSAATAGTDYQAPIGTISGIVKGNGANALIAAVAGTDYQSAQSVTGIVKSSGTTRSAATSGTDYAPGTSALTTGIVKSTTATGALSIAVAGTDYIAPYTSQTQKYVFAAPNALDGTPVFRALLASDIPTLNQNTSGTAAGLSATLGADKGGTGVANNVASTLTISGAFGTTLTVSAATNVTLPTSGTLATTAQSFFLGTTSIAINRTTLAQSLTGITSIDGYAANLAGGNATTQLGAVHYQSNTNVTSLLAPNTTTTKKFLRQTGDGTNGAVPAWDTLVAGDIPTLNQNTSGTAAGLSATLVATSGGTGQSVYTVGDILYASTTSALSKLGAGASGYVLTSGGAGVAPSWAAVNPGAAAAGTLTGNTLNSTVVNSSLTSFGTTPGMTSPAITTSLTTPSTSFDLVNTTATTVNFARAATTLSIGAVTGTTTVNNDLVVTGTFTVNGNTETINATTIQVADKNIELGKVVTPTDTTANGGGITLKGATDKTIIWDSTNANWSSSEHWNLVTGKKYKINNIDVLTASTVLNDSSQISVTVAGFATTLGIATSAAALTTITLGSTVTGNILKVAGTTGGTINLTTDVTSGIVNEWQSVTGTINIGASGTIKLGTSGSTATTVYVGGAVDGNILRIGGTTSGTTSAITTDVTTGTFNMLQSVTGTINIGSSGTVQIGTSTAAATTVQVGGAIAGNILKIAGTSVSTTTGITTDVTTGTFNMLQSVTGTVKLGASGTVQLGTSTTAVTTVQVGGAFDGNILKLAGTAAGTAAAITSDTTTGTVSILDTGLTGTLKIGGSATTLTIGTTTAASTYNFATGATLTSTIKAINIGTSGVSGSTTNIALGSSVSGATGTTTINTALTVTPATAGTITLGATAGTGALTFGSSTASQTTNIANGITASGNTNTIAIGNNGAASSTTSITVGSTAGTSTLTFQGALADATATSTAKSVGYIGTPINTQAGTYTLVIGDAGKTIYAGGNLTIPANGTVAFPIGTIINVIASAGITIAITTDTLQWGGQASSSTGTRTVATYGMATLVKVAATTWYISGAGVT